MPDSAIQSLLKKHDYGKALELTELESIKKGETPAIKEQRKHIKQLIRGLESESILTASKYEEKGEMAKALIHIKNALDKVPASQRLKEYYRSLEAERDQRLIRAETRLLLGQVSFLLMKKELLAEKKRLKGAGFTLWRQGRKIEATLTGAKDRILEYGRQALARGELNLAGECLISAQKIDNNKKVQAALIEWHRALDNLLTTKQKHPAGQNKNITSQEKRFLGIQEAENNIVSSLADSDYIQAQHDLERLQDLNGISPEIEQLIEEKIQKLLNQGNRLYRSGEIEGAKKVWQHVLLLEPTHPEAIDRIKRAEKVINRLQELSH